MESCFKWGAAYSFMLSVATWGVCFSAHQVFAQVTPDRTLGSERSVVNPNVVIKGLSSDRIDGGAQRGANLFHSFLDFNVAVGRGVYFSNPAGVGNIFSRVTGSNASTIAGKLGVLGNANLFLLNPHGIIFTQNASLDVAGAFVASTAQNLLMADGTTYSASSPTAASMLTVSVPLGVQFGSGQPAAIMNSGNLTTGGNLALIGGTVVSTGQLNAPAGNVVVAAVPAGSAVNLSPAGQLLNISTPATTTPTTPAAASLVPLAQGDGTATGLTLNGAGQVALAGSGLPVVEGDVAVRQLIGQTATLTASHNLTLVESQLQTAGDLNLLAADTVRVRDSVANPFIASAGGQLLVQGKQAVDLFALNNAISGLFSGGNMVLQSASTVGGDAHYYAGGDFRIETLDGSAGNLFSPHDPVIRASGDVNFASYTGASLQILAGGSVNVTGSITINGLDAGLPDPSTTDNPGENVPLSRPLRNGDQSQSIFMNADGSQYIFINGKQEPALDIRAGMTRAAIRVPLTPQLPPYPVGIEPDPNLSFLPQTLPTHSDITIGAIIFNSGVIPIGKDTRLTNVFLTNQFSSTGHPGDISIGNQLSGYSIQAFGGNVAIDSGNDVTIPRGIVNGSGNGVGGNTTILSGGTITVHNGSDGKTSGSLVSLSNKEDAGSVNLSASKKINVGAIDTEALLNANLSGNSGSITLTAQTITTEKITSRSAGLRGAKGTRGQGGDIDLTAQTITTGDILSESLGANGVGGNITLTAQNSLTVPNITSKAINGTFAQAGDIRLISQNRDVNITGKQINATSKNDGNNPNSSFSTIQVTARNGTVTIQNSQLLTTNNGNGLSGDILIDGKNINIGDPNSPISCTSSSNCSNSVQSEGFNGRVLIGTLFPSEQVSINNSLINTETISRVDNLYKERSGEIRVHSQAITIGGSQITATINSDTAPGSILLDATGAISINNSSILDTVSSGADLSKADPFDSGLLVLGNSISLTNSTINASTSGIGRGADVFLLARNGGDITLTNNSVETNSQASATGGAGSIQINSGSLSISGNYSNKDLAIQAADTTNNKDGSAGDIRIGSLNNHDLVQINNHLNSPNAFSSVDTSPNAIQIYPLQPDGSFSTRSFLPADVGSPFSMSTLKADNSTISTSTGAGQAGNISVDTTQSVSLTGGTRLLAQATAGGTAGNITVTTPTLTVEKGAEISVNGCESASNCTGIAGNLYIFAGRVFLNNGTLSANTGKSEDYNRQRGKYFLVRGRSYSSCFSNLNRRAQKESSSSH